MRVAAFLVAMVLGSGGALAFDCTGVTLPSSDSGASDVLIPADVVLTLFRTETLTGDDFTGTKTYILADGSKLPSEQFVLGELKVGDHRAANVTASVGPPTSEPLLGQSFLSRFNSWTLDNGRHALILTENHP